MAKLTLTDGLRQLAKKEYSAVHADCIAAIHEDINNPVPFFLLGVVSFDHQNYAKALELLEKSSKLDPSEPYYPAYLAMTLSILRRSNEARHAADIAAKIFPHTAHLSDLLGVVYSRSGYHERALPHFKAATEKSPSHSPYFFNLAASEQFLGNFKAAKGAYEEAIKINGQNYRAWSSLISLERQTQENNHLDLLETAFENRELDSDAKLHIGHAVAKTYEDLGKYEQSFDWLQKAKADKRNQFPFDRESNKKIFQAARATSQIATPPPTSPQDVTPIFIVGLPRTGTTLVDRILSSHTKVTSAGELNVFAEQVKRLGPTKTPYVLDAPTLMAANKLEISRVGAEYLKSTAPLAQNAPNMVDKMPLNFFYAALMTRAFSKVKIIALRRGAMDSCLSNFRQLFSTQFSYYNYTYDLEETANFYREFDALMDHWRAHLPSAQFLEVDYEDIVHDQENQTRKLLDFCDLPWEENCMRFHENTAAVSTASSVQVRQPLYSGSIDRWKKYGDKLDGLRAALGDLAN